MNDYRTIRGTSVAEIEEKHSRFIASAAFADTEEKALAFLEKIRSENRTARHNVFAYCLREGNRVRYSDDGEPAKTAGTPVLECIQHRELKDVIVVVTRYFGGILLGTGGLVRAYTASAAAALDAAQVSIMELTQRVLFDVPYPLWDKFSYALQSLPCILERSEFQSSVDATLLIRASDLERVTQQITALSDGKIDFLPTDELFYPWPEA